MCREKTRENASLFKSLGFIKLNRSTQRKTYEKNRSKTGKCIFDMKYVFIPINVGGHLTCVVVYMEEKRICYYDSYKSTKTRSLDKARIEKRTDILKTVLQYLETKHSEKRHCFA